MSFWNLSNNESAVTTTTGVFDSNPDIEPIPENTNLMTMADEVVWDEYEGVRFIKIRWTVLDGEYKNRKIFQKIHVCSHEAKKRDKAVKMLAAIDANAGGELCKIVDREPTDQDLMSALMNKTMIVKVGLWETDSGAKGNWVKAVAPVSAPNALKTPVKPQVAQPQGFDESIGF